MLIVGINVCYVPIADVRAISEKASELTANFQS